ncbi:MAG: hypothetical protein UU08_C0001G0050 [Candidatus Uhrbacteria bacterium GW2011_GWE2_40_58]|nr:MAG: hypothetical protein UU08_C0001G0050 [Candidatus Uhrbacteria bacterium GW2011_GWE2_40_58]OGL97535.1 MAG: hypothetical protein A2332_00340 [Candidatus Uhrbacteria bacterium RIFOXYB2_FULL_41_18]HBK35076.1 hypothetical protein [Candidatus Uhrbacteria bacterium]HCB56283.1 hypothetical protein [Candidatus Uhrbacteria bacterium]
MASSKRVSLADMNAQDVELLKRRYAHCIPIYRAAHELFVVLSDKESCPIGWFLTLESVTWLLEILGEHPHAILKRGNDDTFDRQWQEGLIPINNNRKTLITGKAFSTDIGNSIHIFMKNLEFLIVQANFLAETRKPIQCANAWPHCHW